MKNGKELNIGDCIQDPKSNKKYSPIEKIQRDQSTQSYLIHFECGMVRVLRDGVKVIVNEVKQ